MWAGSWLRRREEYSADRSVDQWLETLANQKGRRNLSGEDTLTLNRSTKLRMVMTARRRLCGRYAIAARRPGTAMVLQLVFVGEGMRRFPPGLGQANDDERDGTKERLERVNHRK